MRGSRAIRCPKRSARNESIPVRCWTNKVRKIAQHAASSPDHHDLKPSAGRHIATPPGTCS
eukprot:2130438-Pyramimonas_sp.AAC.1